MRRLVPTALVLLLGAPALAGPSAAVTGGMRVRPIGVRVTTQAAVFDRVSGDARTLGVVQAGQVYVLLRTDVDAVGERVRIRFSNEDGWIDKAALMDVPGQPIYMVAALPSLQVGGLGRLDNGVFVAPVAGDERQRLINYAGKSAWIPGSALRGPIDRDNPFPSGDQIAGVDTRSLAALQPAIDPKTGLATGQPGSGQPGGGSPGGGSPGSQGPGGSDAGSPLTGPGASPSDLGGNAPQADTGSLQRSGNYVQLPASGPGFKSYASPDRRWGMERMVAGIMRTGAHWARLPRSVGSQSRSAEIEIGDISQRGGGKISGHVSHQRGVDADVRPSRNDGRGGPVTIQQGAYSRQFTEEAIQLFRRYAPVSLVLFNDSRVPGVRNWPNHANHYHLRIN